MEEIAKKRIVKDLQILNKNKDELQSRGIYIHADENNVFAITCLIIPQHKEEDGLQSPYTHGFFVFNFIIPHDYPISPPKVTFHPSQSSVRLHPNFYENGYVCLSVINSWASPDWTASMSLLSVINVLDARFTERPLAFEPGHEQDTTEQHSHYNKGVRYGVYYFAICNILENTYEIYTPFKDIITQYYKSHKSQYLEEIQNIPIETIQQKPYQHQLKINYTAIQRRLLEYNKSLED